MIDALVAAIVEDDRAKVKSLLKADRRLASTLIKKARLFQSGIFHWIYVDDTPLHLAAAGYRVAIARQLIAAGANPNGAGKHRGGTPLHYAADGFIDGPAWDEKMQARTIALLLDAGASINAQDKNGATPLHRAVRTRCAAAVRQLLEAGSNPKRKNKSGSTPFHLAVQNTGRGGSGTNNAKQAQQKIIEIFLSRDVPTSLTDGHGKTVSDCARSQWIQKLLGSAVKR